MRNEEIFFALSSHPTQYTSHHFHHQTDDIDPYRKVVSNKRVRTEHEQIFFP